MRYQMLHRNNLKNIVLELFGWLVSRKLTTLARIFSSILSRNSFTPCLLNLKNSYREIEARAEIIKNHIELAKCVIGDSTKIENEISIQPTVKAYFIRPTNDSLTSEVLKNLSDSFQRCVGQSSLIFDDTSVFPHLLQSELFNSSASDDLQLVFFELHSLINLQDESLIAQLQNLDNSKIRIFILCFDLWRESDRELIENWKGPKTTFLHMDNTIYEENLLEHKKLLHWFFVGHFPDSIKEPFPLNRLFFSGNVKTSDRRAWIINLVEAADYLGVAIDLKLFSYGRKDNNRQEYGDFIKSMSASMYILGLAQKSDKQTLITFRSIEAVALGRVLIQQELTDSRPLQQFFIPYYEYLPFESPVDLAAYLYLIRNEPSLFIEIGNNASRKWSSLHAPHIAWHELLSSIDSQ